MASAGAIFVGLISAPCFISLLLIPLGLGAFMSTGVFIFLDGYRYLFMALALLAVLLVHWVLRRGQFRPTRTIWVITFFVIALVAAELIVDPPWARHALVPM